jgi:hypothetical protein
MCDTPLDAAFSCGDAGPIPPPDTGSAGCDTCIENCASMEWCVCAADSSIDDAGQPGGCLGFVGCVQLCLYPPADSGVDGGTVTGCSMQCGAAFSMQQDNEGAALLSAIVSNCAAKTECGQ